MELSLPHKSLNIFQRHPLISYHDQDSIFRVMVVLGKKYQEFRIKKTDELLNNIIAFKRLLSTIRSGSYTGFEFNEFVELASCLYNLLIEPIDFIKPGQTLFIQPDGDLLGLPFEILLPGDQKNKSNFTKGTFRDLPYLLKENPVFYLSSIYSFKKSPEKGNESLHFDGHAYINDKDFNESELGNGLDWQHILSDNAKGKSIYLNGCETGLGPYYSGEGLMSLGLAYLLSGAQQVIENFWMVSEESSSKIASEFYRNGGFNKPATALRKAKLSYMENAPDGMDHPHYWAGTMVQGQQEENENSLAFLWIILAVPLMIFFRLIFKHRL